MFDICSYISYERYKFLYCTKSPFPKVFCITMGNLLTHRWNKKPTSLTIYYVHKHSILNLPLVTSQSPVTPCIEFQQFRKLSSLPSETHKALSFSRKLQAVNRALNTTSIEVHPKLEGCLVKPVWHRIIPLCWHSAWSAISSDLLPASSWLTLGSPAVLPVCGSPLGVGLRWSAFCACKMSCS